ncbi:MAG: HU family DNA-binding protein [Planctomycetota bacterium]
MNKAGLIEAVAGRALLGRKEAEAAVEAVFAEIIETLKKGEEASVVGFGVFAPSRRKAKMGRNPHTGEPVPVPARVVATFRAGKHVKKALASVPLQ